jgi:hypothetical protein
MNNKVTLPYHDMEQAVEWAKTHCPSYITNQASASGWNLRRVPGGWVNVPDIDFFFDNTDEGERDMVLFILRWT